MAPPRRTFDVSHKLLPLSSRVVVVPGRIGHPHVTTHDDGKAPPVRDRVCQRTPAGSTSPNAPRSPWMGNSTRDRSWRPGSSSMASTDSMPDRGCLGSLSARLVEIRIGHCATRSSPAGSHHPIRGSRLQRQRSGCPAPDEQSKGTSLLAAQCQRRRIAESRHPICVMQMMRSPRREVPP